MTEGPPTKPRLHAPDAVLRDPLHGYLLAFELPHAEDREWRGIQVLLRAPAGRKVRAGEGNYLE